MILNEILFILFFMISWTPLFSVNFILIPRIVADMSQSYRVQKLLSNYGYCSRRKAEELIQEGRVAVNGRIISIGDKASADDRIAVDGKVVRSRKKVYLMLNKPTGCVTALKDRQYRTVMDCIKIRERVFPVGRLDFNTSGLLLLTNDGDFSNNIIHPSKEITKTYLVQLDRPITNALLHRIRDGIDIDGKRTCKAKARKVCSDLIEITIHEGRNRIVRRMFSAIGFKVISLKRTRIGSLELGDLGVGRYRSLTEADKRLIFSK
jgi:pseudouridine synthase